LSALPLVDGHLDLAENVTLFGRDFTAPIEEIRAREKRISRQATVSLPELERGGIAVVCATVTPGSLVADVGPDFEPRAALYSTPEEAEAQALRQIDLYEEWQRQGWVRILKSVTDLEHHLELWREDRTTGLVLLMEGADPIVHVKDLPAWWERGLRMIGLTYGDTAYGTGLPGGMRFQGGVVLPPLGSHSSIRWPGSGSSGTSRISPRTVSGKGSTVTFRGFARLMPTRER
jgi:membrane dipeptidase